MTGIIDTHIHISHYLFNREFSYPALDGDDVLLSRRFVLRDFGSWKNLLRTTWPLPLF